MGCAASQPAIHEDLGPAADTPGGATPLKAAPSQSYRSDSAQQYAGTGSGKAAANACVEQDESQQADGSDDTELPYSPYLQMLQQQTSQPTPLPSAQGAHLQSSGRAWKEPAEAAGSADVQKQQRGVTFQSADSNDELSEQHRKEAEVAEALTADGEAKASLFSVVARESTDTVAVALRMSLEDTFSELGACSGRAMNRLSQHFSRRLLKTDRRGSADLDRRQSLNYMKEVDSIVHCFDIQEDEITIEKRDDGSDIVLGKGSYGQVYKGLRGGMQDVAVKVLFAADAHALKNFIQEISLLKSLNYDRNIVQFYGARLQPGQIPMMVLEFMEGGDLFSAINNDKAGQLKWNMKGFGLALDIVKGVHFLHTHNVIHSDLKTSNVLLDRSQSTAKISDVGLARVMEKKEYRSSDEHAWTFVYAAPEMLLGKPCTAASDIFSLGVCLWELVMREKPIRGQLKKPTCPEDCPQAVADLISQCVKMDPEQRPTAREVHDKIKAAHSNALKTSAWFA